ncbi:hypothetical protein CcCBS67573_g03345 [Chytriomyces confervae]|uniref:Uncharacterized protein n=1 Tax=Chytriomyces confervae TaxID=246404 RepID=A0A507FG81_9FUNG|nr:hypothetical protein CcCBS67573_g03345 [Chytriomyces confervae]
MMGQPTQSNSSKVLPKQDQGSEPTRDTVPQPDPGLNSQAAAHSLEAGEVLIAQLRALELRASEYNNLAQKIYNEEQACRKELEVQRKLVKSYLADATKVLSGAEAARALRLQSPHQTAPSKGVPEDSSKEEEDGDDDDDAGPVIKHKVSPIQIAPVSPIIEYTGAARKNSGSAVKTGSSSSAAPVAGSWDEWDELEDVIGLIQKRISRVDSLLPRNAKLILRLALGNSAPFTLRPVGHRLNYKKEVESFKLRYTFFLLALIFISLLLSPTRQPTLTTLFDSLFLFASVYYYSTLTLREHILYVNGSKITFWWFLHHYLSIFMSSIILITPHSMSTTYPQYRTQFLWFCAYLGGVQYLQYRYQRERLYVLVSLDRAERMDLVAGDGVFGGGLDGCGREGGVGRWGHVLLPFLVVGQVWQMVNGVKCITLFKDVFESGRDMGKEWHVLVVGILFAVLGIGNMITTFWSFFSPSREGGKVGKNGARSPDSPMTLGGSGSKGLSAHSLSSGNLTRLSGVHMPLRGSGGSGVNLRTATGHLDDNGGGGGGGGSFGVRRRVSGVSKE